MNEQLKSSVQAADQEISERPLSGSTLPCRGTHDSWLTIELLGEDGVGIANQRYQLTLANGEEMQGKLDAEGKVRIDGLPEGEHMVSFPDLDQEAWEPLDAA